MQNFIPSNRQERCLDSVTYAITLNYLSMDNIEEIVERWLAPVSAAIYSPQTDFVKAYGSALYLRNCLKNSHLIREFVSFHFFFDRKFTPTNISHDLGNDDFHFKCREFKNKLKQDEGKSFQEMKNLSLPVNVGRNIARQAATTHFILSSDADLYPSPGLAKKFLEMYSKREQTKVNE